MKKELQAFKLKRDTKKVVGTKTSDTKFSFGGRDGSITVNLAPFRKSVNGSLNSLIRKDFPKMVEQ
jgi:hypothetical protein